MNYIIENNIDFYNELNKELNKKDDNRINDSQITDNRINDTINDTNICLLTHEPIKDNFIKLICGHTFNYIPLYHEIINQKYNKNSYLEISKLSLNQIKCPYCRNISNKLLPNINIDNVSRKNGVNYPAKYCMTIHKCQWNYTKGNKKNTCCNKDAYIKNGNTFCSYHHNINLRNSNKLESDKEGENDTINIWTEQHEKINKKYRLLDLKAVLRNNNKKISGNKKQLIQRIINFKLNNNMN